MTDKLTDGCYWARIRSTGQVDIVEIGWTQSGRCVVLRFGDEQALDLDQVEIIEAVKPPGGPETVDLELLSKFIRYVERLPALRPRKLGAWPISPVPEEPVGDLTSADIHALQKAARK